MNKLLQLQKQKQKFLNLILNLISPTPFPSYAGKRKSVTYLMKLNNKRFYSTSTSKEKSSNMDFSIFQNLGLDPKYIQLHKSIKEYPVTWSYSHTMYITIGRAENLSYDSIHEFKTQYLMDNITYSIIPIMIDDLKMSGRDIISLSGQIIVTNLVNSQELVNHVERSMLEKRTGYDAEECIGALIFKLRVISFNPVVYNRVVNLDTHHDEVVYKNVPKKMLTFSSEEIPLTLDLNKYGFNIKRDYIVNGVIQKGEHYLYRKNIVVFVHDGSDKLVRNLTIFKNNAKYAECIDLIDENSTIFVRKFKDGFTLYIDNNTNKVLYTERVINCKPVSKGKIQLIKDLNISSFDIECYVNNNNKLFVPYSCGYVTPNKDVSLYFLLDFKSPEEMLLKCLNDMLSSKLGTVYVHNLSRFDSFYIIPLLHDSNNGFSCIVEYKDNSILSIKITSISNKKLKMVIKDSKLMIPGSLRILAKNYGVAEQKGVFPYDFPNADNLTYQGVKPAFKFYSDITEDDYNLIPNENWNLKAETCKYLKSDLLGLQEVVIKFAEEIFEGERLNITKMSTTSSLAWKIFTTNYLGKDLLYQVIGPAHYNMREGYYGGTTEVYVRKTIPNSVVRIYDVNSSYPASMKQKMPSGKPVFSTDPGGLDKYFGVVFAEVETPKDSKGNYISLEFPPLPFRSDNVIINPIGRWKGWYCSELLKYVRDVYNYKINVYYGYKYDKSDGIFTDYVDKFYNIKAGCDPLSTISRNTSKLLLNGLYGRSGMKPNLSKTKIFTTAEADIIHAKYNVLNQIHITHEKEKIKYIPKINSSYKNVDLLDVANLEGDGDNANITAKENDSLLDIEQCLPVAIFTAAYSSIRLFEGIRNIQERGGIVYTVDTDSIHTNIELPEEMVGESLGQWKLEFIGDLGYYPLPKIYYVRGYKVKNGLKVGERCELKKGRGVKSGSFTLEEYISLYNCKPIIKDDLRFVIDWLKSTVSHKTQQIKFSPKLNKRCLVFYNKNYSATKPFVVIDGKVTGTKPKMIVWAK